MLPGRPKQCPTAVLLDMDGTLIDTEPLWERAQVRLAREFGVPFGAEDRAATIGTPASSWLPGWLASAGLGSGDEVVAEAAARIEAEVLAAVSENLLLKKGAATLLEELVDRKAPCALVSASPRRLVDAVLAQLDPAPFVGSISGDDVARPKPDPEPYLAAARLVGARPEHTVAIEDSLTGARSASRAGCRVLWVPTDSASAAEEHWKVLGSLSEIDLDALLGGGGS